MSKRVVIAGAGGFGRGVYSWLQQSSRHLVKHEVDDLVFIDDAIPEVETVLPVVGTIRHYEPESNDEVLVAVGVPHLRKQIVEHLRARNARFHTFVDDRVVLGGDVQVGIGTIICPGTVISANARVGSHVHINFNSSIGHDTVLGEFVTLSPMSNIMGETIVGSEVFVGGSAVVLPRIEIADGATIGAGATVVQTIESSATVVGNPAASMNMTRKLTPSKGTA